MLLFAQAILICWFPIVLGIFATRPPKQAVITSYIVAWLFLPLLSFPLPGIPDYSKMSATTMGIFLGVLLFDSGRLAGIRPRLFDLPMTLWCVAPMFSSISAGLGAYEGASATLAQVISWGLPYLVGRLYLSDTEGIRQLAVGMVVGGLAYAPLCLLEVRLSPVLLYWVYGLVRYEVMGMRYGGYRPKVFLQTGLEVGTWMANATLIAYWLWSTGAVRAIRGYSMGRVALVLLVTTILCKSVGSIVLMAIGMATLRMIGRARWIWLAWALIAMPPAYEFSRASGLWSGREAVAISEAVFGDERAASLKFRLENEDALLIRSQMRPLLGWGRNGGFQEVNKQGFAIQVLDGYWIITIGFYGVLGLAAMTVAWLLPMALLARRERPARWAGPEVGPAAALCVVLALYMIDNISNAMANPIYGLALGGVIAFRPGSRGAGRTTAEACLSAAAGLAEGGRPAEAEPLYLEAIARAEAEAGPGPGSGRTLAGALEGLGASLTATGRAAEAEPALREALAIRRSLASGPPDPGAARDLAIAGEALARALAESGRAAEAVGLREAALRTWDRLTASSPGDVEARDRRAVALNDLAWLLATEPDAGPVDPALALALAEEAVRVAPGHLAPWNTLGVARYRAGDWAGAAEALGRSAASPGGGTAFDSYFLAMVGHHLGDEDAARTWFDRAVAWAGRHRPGHPALARFHAEASALIEGPARPGEVARRARPAGPAPPEGRP